MLDQLGLLAVKVEDSDASAVQLVKSEKRTLEIIHGLETEIEKALKPATPYRGIDIVACGSLARHEWTLGSDFDYLILVNDQSMQSAVRDVQRKMYSIVAKGIDGDDQQLKPPGATGTFGQAITSFELASKIGLETDTNAVTTRRILMLEESISLRNKTQHDELIENILDRYLSEYRSGNRIPRLLLNDVVKYWRIIAVDYSSKNWTRPTDDGWGLRYLKLRITRKLAFAGMLAAMFEIALGDGELNALNLYENLRVPALARLGRLADYLDDTGKDALRCCVRLAGSFNMMLDDIDFRDMASSLEWDGMQNPPEDFRRAERLSHDLQVALEALFFDGSKDLGMLTRKYGIF